MASIYKIHFFIFSSTEMRIAVLSQNCAGLNADISFDKLLSGDPEVYIEMTQEDARPVNGQTLLQSEGLGEYRILTTVALNTGASTQNLIMTCLTKAPIDYVSGSIPISPSGNKIALYAQGLAHSVSRIGYSKGAVYIKLLGPRPILFINMHLPMSGAKDFFTGALKNSTLGLAYRTAALHELLAGVRDLVDARTTVFIGGDLNFRMDADGTDQLDTLLATGDLPYGLQEVVGPTKTVSCKFTRRSRACRTRRLPRTGLRKFLAQVQTECGDKGRVPSRCDRFLVGGAGILSVRFIGSEVFMPDSDHNGIYTCFDLLGKLSGKH
jgi:hypothetical protein